MEKIYRVKVKNNRKIIRRPLHLREDYKCTQEKIKYPGYNFVISSIGIPTKETKSKFEYTLTDEYLSDREGDVIEIIQSGEDYILKIDFGFPTGIKLIHSSRVILLKKYFTYSLEYIFEAFLRIEPEEILVNLF